MGIRCCSSDLQADESVSQPGIVIFSVTMPGFCMFYHTKIVTPYICRIPLPLHGTVFHFCASCFPAGRKKARTAPVTEQCVPFIQFTGKAVGQAHSVFPIILHQQFHDVLPDMSVPAHSPDKLLPDFVLGIFSPAKLVQDCFDL